MSDHIECRHCGVSAYPLIAWRQFENETWHLEATCHACGRFIKWLPQVEPWLDGIEPHA